MYTINNIREIGNAMLNGTYVPTVAEPIEEPVAEPIKVKVTKHTPVCAADDAPVKVKLSAIKVTKVTEPTQVIVEDPIEEQPIPEEPIETAVEDVPPQVVTVVPRKRGFSFKAAVVEEPAV